MKKLLIAVIAFLIAATTLNTVTIAQNTNMPQRETLEGNVKAITEQQYITDNGVKTTYQTLQVLITTGSLKGKTVSVQGGQGNNSNDILYKKGDNIAIMHAVNPDGSDTFYATDYIRRGALYTAILIFIVLALIISKTRGLRSLIGMTLSFFIIFTYVLPQISTGGNPIVIAIIASILIVPITFYMSHGINKKTTAAIIATYIALILIGIISVIVVHAAKLTGFESDDAMFLAIVKQGTINIKNVMLAGIIIGTLGILDDITVSQSAVVFQLQEVTKGELNIIELYKSAMKIGQDHTASTINTLILVYAGASLPLLLLFTNNPKPFSEVINHEIIATEIVKAVVGSIGLILAVPITTAIACIVIDVWGLDSEKRRGHSHNHTH